MSIGIVISHDAMLDLPALLAQADHALYRAKDSGRNRVEIASIELILDRAGAGRCRTPGRRAAASAAKPAAKSATTPHGNSRFAPIFPHRRAEYRRQPQSSVCT